MTFEFSKTVGSTNEFSQTSGVSVTVGVEISVEVADVSSFSLSIEKTKY